MRLPWARDRADSETAEPAADDASPGADPELTDTGESAADIVEPTERPRWLRGAIKASSWAGTIITILVLFLAWPLAWGGFFSYTVVSGISMEPTYHTGDVVMTVRRGAYQVGDVVVYTPTFEGKTGAVIHRIVKITPDGDYVTIGDNNAKPDPWLATNENIRGEVIADFPQAYKIIGLIKSPLVWIIPIGVMVTWFFWPSKEQDEDSDDDDESDDSESDAKTDHANNQNRGGSAGTAERSAAKS